MTGVIIIINYKKSEVYTNRNAYISFNNIYLSVLKVPLYYFGVAFILILNFDITLGNTMTAVADYFYIYLENINIH